MSKTHELRDAYRFPFFTPSARVQGTFRDPHGMVIDLARRQKKRSAVHAAQCAVVGTTDESGVYAICPAGPNASISASPFAVFPAPFASP